MKNLSSIERKHILLGIILMWGAILLFILQNNDTDSLNTFRIFLPVFWGIFTIVTVLYIIVQSLLQHSEIKRLEEQSLSTDELAEKDNRRGNANILKSANILALVAMVVGYFTSSLRNMPIQYTTYQPIVWIVILCFDVCMYMVALFKEEPKEEVVDKSENSENKERVGVQIISIEEAVEYLEGQGYEIENIERLGIESKKSDPALEDKSEEEIQNENINENETNSIPSKNKAELGLMEESKEQQEEDEGKEENSESTEQLTKEKVDIKSQNLPVTISPTKNNPKVTVVVKKKQSRHSNNKRRKSFK